VIADNPLQHGKSLLILTARDFEDVPCVLLAQGIALHFFRYSFLIKDSPKKSHSQAMEPYCFFSSFISITFALPVNGYDILNYPMSTNRAGNYLHEISNPLISL